MATDYAKLAAEFGGAPATEAPKQDLAALAAEFGGQPAAPEPVVMGMKDFQAEVLKRARAGQSPDDIRAFAETVRDPNDPTGKVRNVLGPELDRVVGEIQGGYTGPVQMANTTEGDPFGAALRGGADALTFNNADEIQAGLQSAFGDGTYDEYVTQARADRAIDANTNPNERMLGQGLGTLASTAIPLGRVLDAATLGGRIARGSGVGAAFSGVSGFGAAQSVEQGLDGLPGDLIQGGIFGAAIPLGGAGANAVRNNLTREGRATTAMEKAGIDPIALRAAAQDYFEATGKGPRIAEIIGPAGDRLRTNLAAAPETRYRAAQAAEEASRDLLAGTRSRAGSIPAAQAAQDEAALATRAKVGEGDLVSPVEAQLLAGVRSGTSVIPATGAAQDEAALALRARVGDGDLVAPRKEQLRADIRRQVDGLPAGSDSELEAARKALDKANYGAVEKTVVNLSEEDRIILGKILEDTPMATATKTGNKTQDGITQRLEENRLTGLDLQVIRENLLAGPRNVITKTGQTFQNMAEDLDGVIGANLPELLQARRASFQARSLEEGAATAQAAVKNSGREAVDALGDLRTRTPEQTAGVTVGGVQGVLNNTSTTDRAYSFAENLAANADYATAVTKSLPPGIGGIVSDIATAAKAHIDDLESLGLKGVGPSSAKFEAVIAKVLDDPKFAGKLRQMAPQFADDFINYARVQRDFLDRTKSLGLDKAGDDVGKAVAFAGRLQTDPRYVQDVVSALPNAAGKVLSDFATATKAHIDDLESLGLKGVGPSSTKFNAVIAKVLDDPSFAQKLRKLAPQFADDFINYARVQRDFLDRTKSLGLDKVADDVRKSYAFAVRAQSDPDYVKAVVGAMPEQTGQELVNFAVQQKKAIENLAGLAGVAPDQVPTVLDNAGAMINIGIGLPKGAGGAFLSSIVKGMAEGLGVGQGTARKLADNLFDPAQFEKTARLLEARKMPRSKLDTIVRNAFVKLAGDVGKDNTRAPEGVVTVGQEPQ